MHLRRLFEQYKDHIDFHWIYVREAHAVGSLLGPAEHIKVQDPKSFAARRRLAARSAKALGLTIPQLIDGMDDGLARAYGAFPSRIYLLSGSARVVYRSETGAKGLDATELGEALAEMMK